MPAQLLILNVAISKPGIRDQKEYTWYQCVCISTICNFLHKSGFTCQKLHIIAMIILRSKFASDVSVYSSDMLVFIDETGADKRNAIRRYGYSLHGKPMKSHVFVSRVDRISAIA